MDGAIVSGLFDFAGCYTFPFQRRINNDHVYYRTLRSFVCGVSDFERVMASEVQCRYWFDDVHGFLLLLLLYFMEVVVHLLPPSKALQATPVGAGLVVWSRRSGVPILFVGGSAFSMIRLFTAAVLIVVTGCAHNPDWIVSGVKASRTYRDLRAQGVRVAWMDEERHGDYVELSICENNEFHFLRVATLRVFRSGAVERFCYDETSNQEVWISGR